MLYLWVENRFYTLYVRFMSILYRHMYCIYYIFNTRRVQRTQWNIYTCSYRENRAINNNNACFLLFICNTKLMNTHELNHSLVVGNWEWIYASLFTKNSWNYMVFALINDTQHKNLLKVEEIKYHHYIIKSRWL